MTDTKKEKKVKAFNAVSQKVEDAVVTVDQNNELLFTFADKSFFKLPAGMSADEVKGWLKKYEEANQGQIKAEIKEKERKEVEKVLGDL